jgi:hypothetical protein
MPYPWKSHLSHYFCYKFIQFPSVIIITGWSLFPHSDCFISQLYTTWYWSAPCDYLSRSSFCPQDWCPKHTVQPHTASATRSSITTLSFDFYQFPQAHFRLNCTHQELWDPLTAILRQSLIFKFNYGTALEEMVVTFIIGSTLNSIDWTLTAATAAHAIRHCNTSSTWNACDWCDLVVFSCITYKFYCSNVSFITFLCSSPLLFVLFPSK